MGACVWVAGFLGRLRGRFGGVLGCGASASCCIKDFQIHKTRREMDDKGIFAYLIFAYLIFEC